MDGISNIRIVAVDSKRPPVLRKEPYVEVFFELSHAVPKNWSTDFNALFAKQEFSATIQAEEGLFIETWVRTIDEIPANFAFMKRMVTQCSDQYIAKILASQGQDSADSESSGAVSAEQRRLNTIIAALDFSD